MSKFKIILCLFTLLGFSALQGQCDQNYNWAVWENFTGNSATGTIEVGGQAISIEMTANYSFSSTPGIYTHENFDSFVDDVPNTRVPRTTWSAGSGGVTTMCFSEVVSNPVLLFSSIGSPTIPVTLTLSLPFQTIFDGGGMTFVNDTTIIGAEGFAILLFPGEFDCISIFSTTPENYTNLSWGLNPPLFPVTIEGDLEDCEEVDLVASGGLNYTWSGGSSPNSPSNTFLTSGNYFLTVNDGSGCEVVTSVTVQIENALCIDCAGIVNGTAVLDECGVCLQPGDPNFNQSCIDCAGTPNGSAIIDECGECLEPTNPRFNQSCADCAGVPNGTAVFDECRVCLEPTSVAFNQSCTDCAGILNGTSLVDACGICLEQDAPEFNQSCADCAGTPNGIAIFDECGECQEPNGPNFNQSCTDCAGVLNGSAQLDICGECRQPNDPDFNLPCFKRKQIFIPNVFSPNADGINDRFKLAKKATTGAEIIVYRIYSRWGELVYQMKDTSFEDGSEWWDGTMNGREMQNGIYLYDVEVQFTDGEVKTFSGDVLLVK